MSHYPDCIVEGDSLKSYHNYYIAAKNSFAKWTKRSVCNMVPISLTKSAEEYLKKVGELNVSLTVKGGGCSGFQYEWGTTDKEATVGNLYLNPIAEMFVFGCTIDYVEELGGSYLKVINPNAKASCGCGESFAV